MSTFFDVLAIHRWDTPVVVPVGELGALFVEILILIHSARGDTSGQDMHS